MGVPKFFRYISERYPCLSELVKEYQIPEFDNLYLDMNGIIHMCSHPDDGNPHFRISEEKIFNDVFHYIEVLFRMIRPQKLFFMAIDGVAPRAKMNQQRGRRFRSAKDAEKQENEALKKGEKLPDAARFDSNCITPGTVFMARLHQQLQYFVVNKISNDRTWQKCKVILSGHETPGEGEHKIMDYIRYLRAQPGYNPNTRHCLYGLDADLIMLGLCTHEPHFSLLREEVKFGRKSTSKRTAVPEETTFFLLHLSLMREYLELEFAPLRDKLKGFTYDFEKIIDDWVLMGFLVGNDFIPHLPNLHIANGALPILYKAYMDILPELDGYINESGTLNLARFEKFMEKLSCIDLENFEDIREDLLYMESKTGKKYNPHSKVSTRNLEEWVPEELKDDVSMEALEPEVKTTRDSSLAALIKEADDLCLESDNDEEESISEEDEAFYNYKKEYYMNKLEYAKVTSEVLRDQAEGYVRAIQWNLNYYYNGCCSWSWYYPHHYAPYISDIKGFSDLKIEFDIGKPFLPYEQLLAVLPSASKNLLPQAYHELMTEENSLIKQYYPVDFQTDLNGKKQEWEAVVLVPFIDENLLLQAMGLCNDRLTEEEKARNSHGPMLIYSYTDKDKGIYKSPEYFPPVTHNHTEVFKMMYDDVLVPKEKLVKGAYPGVVMDVYYPGFPTMKHLHYKAALKKAKIKVFEQPSRNENMIITIIPDPKFKDGKIPVDILGTSIFVGWPHLVEAKVVAISNSTRKYISVGDPGQFNVEDASAVDFKQEISGAVEYFQRRMGIEVGETKVLVYVQKMIGRRYMVTPNGRVTLEKQFASELSRYPLQTIVHNIAAYDSYNTVFRDIQQVYPKNCLCFMLTNPYYGAQGVVQDSSQFNDTGRLKIAIHAPEEIDLSHVKMIHMDMLRNYKNLHISSSAISLSPSLYTRLTGSIFVTARNKEGGLKNVNIGLDLKLNKRNKETPGYTKKIGTTWCYSDKTDQLVKDYCRLFPEVIEYMRSDTSYLDIDVENIYGDDWEEKMQILTNWLKSLPSNSIEKQTCGSQVLEPEVIKALEDVLDSQSKGAVKKVTLQVKPNYVYRPEIQSGTLMPDPNTYTLILDRIVNVREGFSVPFGLRGTVIGIVEPATDNDRDRLYDIVFDKPFKDGLALGCSEGRGYRLPPTSFINTSYGKRLKDNRDGKNVDDIISRSEPTHHPSYQAKKTDQKFQKNITPMDKQWYPGQPLFQHNNNPQNSAFVQFPNKGRPQIEMQSQDVRQQFPIQPRPPQLVNYTYQLPAAVPPPGPIVYPHCQQPPIYVPPRMENMKAGASLVQSSQSHPVNLPSVVQQQIQPKLVQQPGNKLQNINNFMPNFVKNAEHTQATTSQVSSQTDSKSTTNISKADSKTNEFVNTNYLKSILKIGETESEAKTTQKKDVSLSNKKKGKDEGMCLDFTKLEQVANAPASIRLLTYYQSNGMGMPRYQYFEVDKMIQAQICVDNKTIIGSPAKSREDASENVAKDVLELLMKKAKGEPELNENFPTPPITWVQPDKIGKKDKQKINNATNKHQPPNKGKIEATAVLSKTFVPLQAVKNHIKTTNNSSKNKHTEEIKENVKKTGNVQDDPKNGETTLKGQKPPKDNSSKPKKGRRTRIAANFVKKD